MRQLGRRWSGVGVTVVIATLAGSMLPRAPGQDCNDNQQGDTRDIDLGDSRDCNVNGVPDECDLIPSYGAPTTLEVIRAADPRALTVLEIDGRPGPDVAIASASSGTVSILSSDGGGSVALSRLVLVAPGLWEIAGGDSDLDGDLDLFTFSQQAGAVFLLTNGGSGETDRVARIADIDTPAGFTVAEFTGDGYPDVVVLGWKQGDLTLVENARDGSFVSSPIVPLGYSQTDSIAHGDFDGDGRMDLVASTRWEESAEELHGLAFLRREEDGFGPPERVVTALGTSDLVAADLDGDAHVDVVAASHMEVILLWNRGDAAFDQAVIPVARAIDTLSLIDLENDGDPDIAGSRDGIQVLENLGARAFADPVRYIHDATGSDVDLAAGDLDGDGLEDLVSLRAACCQGRPGTFALLINDGNRGFTVGLPERVDHSPFVVAHLDFDGDGLPDIAAANKGTGTVSVLFNAGAGTFDRASVFAMGAEPSCIVSLDLDGAGADDLIIGDFAASELVILLSDGEGGVSALWRSPVPVSPYALALFDADGDSDQDLVVTGQGSDILFLENRDGMLEVAGTLEISSAARAVAGVDADRDGRNDVLVVSSTGMKILRNLGGWEFSVQETSFAAENALMARAHDVDGDGRDDVLIGNGGTKLWVHRVLEGGKLNPRASFQCHTRTTRFDIADFDGDGIDEIVTADADSKPPLVIHDLMAAAFTTDAGGNGRPDECDLVDGDCDQNGVLDSVEIASGEAADCNENGVPDACDLKPAPALAPPLAFGVGRNPFGVTLADVDGDGDQEIVTANTLANSVSVLMNRGTSFDSAVDHAVLAAESNPTAPLVVAAADFDADGDLDLVTANGNHFSGSDLRETVSFLENDGTGAFSSVLYLPVARSHGDALVADMNADGRVDVVTVAYSVGAAAVLFGNGDLTFSEAHTYDVPVYAPAVAAADVDDDGDPDLVTPAAVLRNAGDGSFAVEEILLEIASPTDLVAADLDQDADVDLAVVSRPVPGTSIWILRNDGAGGFSMLDEAIPEPSPRAIAAADLEGDGRMDLVSTSHDSVAIRQNLGDAAFAPPRRYPVGQTLLNLAVGDLDGEHGSDVVVTLDDFFDSSAAVVLFNYSQFSSDCNSNAVPDECDLESGEAADEDGDGIVDACLLRLAFRFGDAADALFLRGDSNHDRRVNITDPLRTLGWLALGGPRPPCLDAADGDDNGVIDITDAVFVLNYLFLGGVVLPPPALIPGEDPTPDGLDCRGT